MPIHKMSLEDGVFFTKQVGYVDNVDGRMWASTLSNHARRSELPIVAVVDITEVNRLCPTVTKVFAMALETSNVRDIVIVTGTALNPQVMKIIDKLGGVGGFQFVSTLEEALVVAASPSATPASGYGGGFSPMTSFATYSFRGVI